MTETLKEYQRRIAATAGRANIDKHGRERMKQIGKKGLEKRWGKKRSLFERIFKYGK